MLLPQHFGQVLFKKKGCLVGFIINMFFLEIPVLNANSVDPVQMSCSAASDLGLHCLLTSLL